MNAFDLLYETFTSPSDFDDDANIIDAEIVPEDERERQLDDFEKQEHPQTPQLEHPITQPEGVLDAFRKLTDVDKSLFLAMFSDYIGKKIY